MSESGLCCAVLVLLTYMKQDRRYEESVSSRLVG